MSILNPTSQLQADSFHQSFHHCRLLDGGCKYLGLHHCNPAHHAETGERIYSLSRDRADYDHLCQLIIVYLGVIFKEQEKSTKSKIISYVVLIVGGREFTD